MRLKMNTLNHILIKCEPLY